MAQNKYQTILRIELNNGICYRRHHLMVPGNFYPRVAGSFKTRHNANGRKYVVIIFLLTISLAIKSVVYQHADNSQFARVVVSKYELITREPKTIARKRIMMFSSTNISREEHIKSRHKLKHQKEIQSDFKVVLYSTAKIIYRPVAKHTLPIVNPEMFTIARFFGLKCHHIGYSNLVSTVGINTTLGKFFY